MPVPMQSDDRDRESERSLKSNQSVRSNKFRLLKVRYGNRVENFRYCPNTTSSNDLVLWVRGIFGITNNRTFCLRGEDGSVFVLTPIDFENDEIFRLEIDSEINSDPISTTPPIRPKHDWKYYGNILLMAIFACQNGILMGILTGEYGLFTSLSTSNTNVSQVNQGFQHTLALKNTIFGTLYFILLFLCVQPAVRAVVDLIISCC